MFKKEKIQKKNILFFASSKENAQLPYKLYTHTKEHYNKVYKSFYRRLSGLFFLEWIFAIQRNLPQEVVKEISEYSFRKHVAQQPEKFYTRYLYNILGKIYFIKSYSILRKLNIDTVFLYDDTTIVNKACVLAANVLKIDVKIMHQGYKNNLLMIDGLSTRFNNSIPRNKEIYTNLTPDIHYITQKPQPKHNLVLVLLQPDLSPEMLLHSPWVINQKHLIRIVNAMAKNLPEMQFIIFNAEGQHQNTANTHFTTKPFTEFLPYCSGVVTVSNQEALAALEEQKPLINLGNCYFNIEDITHSASSETQLLKLLTNLNSLPLNFKTCNGLLYCLNNVFATQCYNTLAPTPEELDAILKYK